VERTYTDGAVPNYKNVDMALSPHRKGVTHTEIFAINCVWISKF